MVMRRRHGVFTFVVFALVLSCEFLSSAQAFVVAENPNNALDTFPNDPGDNLIGFTISTLIIEAGNNIALGGLGNCFGFSCRDDYDSFRIQVPAGLQINSTELLVLNPDGTAEQLWVFPAPASGLGTIRFPSTSTPTAPNDDWKAGALFALTDSLTINGADPRVSNAVLGPGYYDVVAFNFAFVGAGVWEATFAAGVHLVPLPAAIWLAASALGLLGFARRIRPGRVR